MRMTQQTIFEREKRMAKPKTEPLPPLALPEADKHAKLATERLIALEFAQLGTPRLFTVKVEPMGAPRMSRRDKWKPRPVVRRYWEYCDAIRKAAGGRIEKASAVFARFYVPVPAGLSKKEAAARIGNPHRLLGDVDNQTKGLLDSLISNDGCVYMIAAFKRWCAIGEERIEVAIYD